MGETTRWEFRISVGIRVFLCGLALVFGFENTLYAQLDAPNAAEPGFVPYGAAATTGIDNVSLGTHGLTVRLPLLSFAQRGSLHYAVDYFYDTPIWKYKEICRPNAPGADPTCTSHWLVPAAPLPIRAFSAEEATIHGTWTPGWMVTISDGQGSSHMAVPVKNSFGNVYATVDGSNLVGSFSVQSGGVNAQQYAIPPTWVIDANGVKTTTAANGSETIEDANGNYISYSVSNSLTGVVDTMGRTYNQAQENLNGTSDPSCNGTSSILNYPGPNGQQTQIRACVSSGITVQANFGGRDKDGNAISPASGTIYLVTSLSVYDGNSWSTSPTWKFDYTNGLGDLTKITLPGGGSISYSWTTVPAFVYGDNPGSPFMTRAVATRTADPGDGSAVQEDVYGSGTITNALGDVSQHTLTGFGGPLAYETVSLPPENVSLSELL